MTSLLRPTRDPDGALRFELRAAPAHVRIAGRDARLYAYDGTLPGPTLEAHEGDRVRLVFHNGLDEPSNLHVHGMHMPPEVDDPHLVVAPGGSTTYEFTIPTGAAGTYWYHPHVHGEVAWQLGAGLSGAMVVRGPDDAGALAGACEHVLVLSDVTLDGDRPRPRSVLELHDGREGELQLVGGEPCPELSAPTGLVRLRVINASSARFHDLVLEDAPMWLVGLDAALLDAPVAIEHLLLPPGQRADLLVRASQPGRLALRSRFHDRGAMRWPWSRPAPRQLATLVVHGEPREVALPRLSRPVERLDPARAVATRIFEYGGQGNLLRMVFELARGRRYGAGEGGRGPVRFWLNGREFAPGRIDVEAELGTMEIWELRNPTPLDHPFHVHIHPFQVLDVDGVAPGFVAWQDVVNVPSGSTVRIMIPFRDFPGTTMYHCHVLEHEDNGMMGHVRVVDPRRPDAAQCAAGHR